MKHNYQVVCTEHWLTSEVGKVLYGPASYEMAVGYYEGYQWHRDCVRWHPDIVRLQIVDQRNKKDK